MWNPSAMTATEEGQDEDSVTTKRSGVDDGGSSQGPNRFGPHFLSSPYNSPDFADVPRHDIQGDRETNSLWDWNRLIDSKSNADLNDSKNDKPESKRENEMSLQEAIAREFCDPTDKDNTITADHRKPEALMDFMQPCCESAAGYPIKAHRDKSENSRVSRLPLSSYSSSESGTFVLPLVGNFGVTGNNNNVNTVPCPYSSSQNVDGNFLSLGIGGAMEIKSNSNFSTREIASKLGDPVSSHYNSPIVGQSPTNPWNFTPFTAVQTNASGLSNSPLSGSSRFNPIQFPGLQTPQANPQSTSAAIYDNFIFGRAPSSSPCGIPISPRSSLGTQVIRTQVIPRQQQYSRRSSMNASSESFISYLSDRPRGSSVSHAQLGRLVPTTEARRTKNIGGVHFPGNVRVGNPTSQAEGTSRGVANTCPSLSSVQPVANENSLLPDRFGFPISRVSNIQSAGAGPFPRRLGVQLNGPAVGTIRGTAIGLAAQAYPVRPLLPSGQYHHGMSAQQSTDFPRADYSSGIHLPAQAYPVRPLVSSSGEVTPVARFGGVRPLGSPVSHPRLKRQATVNSSAAELSQRRKISPQPVVMNPSVPAQRPSIPAPIRATRQIAPAPFHIKWRGFDEPLEPSGQKCPLCKIDISFTAEGSMYQPAILPPAAAVLPCGHTFHDACLRKITPDDCLENPPCIPCALGET